VGGRLTQVSVCAWERVCVPGACMQVLIITQIRSPCNQCE
jgi:hypothetical protein